MKNTLHTNKKYDIDFSKLDLTFNQDDNASRVTNILDEKSVELVIEKIKKKHECSETEALLLVTGLMQGGGSNKSAGNSTKYTFGELSLSTQELQGIITSIVPRATNRQLARALSSEIADLAIHLNIEGDLANQMRYDYPDLNATEAAWCSNFQTTNPDCPEKVRQWLVSNYRNRFNK